MHTGSHVVELSQALASCDAVLSYGGNGFISACLLAGKPLVFFIRDLETFLSARQVEKLGAGVLPQPLTASGMMDGLARILQNPTYKSSAENFARVKLAHVSSNAARAVASEVVKTMLS